MIFSNRLMHDLEHKCECSMQRATTMFAARCRYCGNSIPFVQMYENGFCCMVFKGDYDTVSQVEDFLKSKIG